MYTLKVILGSTRPNRTSEKLLPWLQSELLKHANIKVEVLDLRENPLPFYDQPTSPSQVKDGAYPTQAATAWAQKIKEADAFLVIAPEYNHSFPAVLKNAFDTVYAEWNNKPIAFVAYGTVGGARSVEQLRGVAVELQMAPIRAALHIHSPWTLMDEKGAFKTGALEAFNEPLHGILTQLSWWADALKVARSSTK